MVNSSFQKIKRETKEKKEMREEKENNIKMTRNVKRKNKIISQKGKWEFVQL